MAITYSTENQGRFPLDQREISLNLIVPDAFRADMYVDMGQPDPSLPGAAPNNVWMCPDSPWFGYAATTSIYPASVALTYVYLGNGFGYPTGTPPGSGNGSYELDYFRRPTRVGALSAPNSPRTLFADEVAYYAPGQGGSRTGFLANHTLGNGGGSGISGPQNVTGIPGANQVFSDGHGEWVTSYPATLLPGTPSGGGNANATHKNSAGTYVASWWW